MGTWSLRVGEVNLSKDAGDLSLSSAKPPTPASIRPANRTETQKLGSTWTPEVCRIMAFYRYWAIILPTFGGLGSMKC